MTRLVRVTANPNDQSWGSLQCARLTCACRLGKAGVVPVDQGREGDGATPLGRFQFLRLFYRADRMDPPMTGLPIQAIKPNDGWCDEPNHEDYNRLISFPFSASAERLWRDDHVYDLVIEIGHNHNPVVPGLGSAIFVHLMADDKRPTLGCLALEKKDLFQIIMMIDPSWQIEIST